MALTAAKLEGAIRKMLVDALQGDGFARAGQDGVERWRSGVYFYIGAIVAQIGGENRVEPVGQLGFEDVKRICSAFMDDDPEEANKIAVHLQIRHCHFTGEWGSHLVCQEESELSGFLDKLRRFVTKELLPRLELHADPKKVLELYLGFDEKKLRSCKLPGWTGYSSALGALALARLHGPTHYGTLKERYMPVIQPLMPAIRDRALGLISYLDQDPLPPIRHNVLNDHSV